MSPTVPAAEKGWTQWCDAGSPFCRCCSRSSSVLLAGSCQIAPSAFLHCCYLETPQDVKKETPLFALLHCVSFCPWRFCCLTWYKSWRDHFLCCTLNFVFTALLLFLQRVACGPAAACLRWLTWAVHTKASTANEDGSAGIHTAAALLLSALLTSAPIKTSSVAYVTGFTLSKRWLSF